MSDFKAIRLLRSLLKHREKWYLDPYCPQEFSEIGNKAKSIADKRLSQLSLLFLWQRYKRWAKSEPIIRNSDDYFHSFLSDVAFNLASENLTGLDKVIFDDVCYFQFHFI